MTQVMRLQYTCQPGEADGEQYVMRKQKRNRDFRPWRQVVVHCQINVAQTVSLRTRITI